LMVTLTSDMTTSDSALCRSPTVSVFQREYTADRFDGVVDTLLNVAARGFERARMRRRLVELAGKPRPVAVERVDLVGKRSAGAVGLAAALGRGIERIEREREAPLGEVD
jgi:hypothetical protein